MNCRLHILCLTNSIGKWLRSLFDNPNAIIVRTDSLLGQQIVAYKEALAEEVLKFKNTTPTQNFIEQTRDLQLALLEMKGKINNLSEEQINKEREIILANSIWRSDLADEGKTIEEIQKIERKIEYDHFCQIKALDEERELQTSNLNISSKSSSEQLHAIAKRCCVRPWRLPLGEAQIANGQLRLELAESGKTVEDIQRLERESELRHLAQGNTYEELKISTSKVISKHSKIITVEPILDDEEEYNFGIYLKRLESEDQKESEKILNSASQKLTISKYGFLSRFLFKVKCFLIGF